MTHVDQRDHPHTSQPCLNTITLQCNQRFVVCQQGTDPSQELTSDGLQARHQVPMIYPRPSCKGNFPGNLSHKSFCGMLTMISNGQQCVLNMLGVCGESDRVLSVPLHWPTHSTTQTPMTCLQKLISSWPFTSQCQFPAQHMQPFSSANSFWIDEASISFPHYWCSNTESYHHYTNLHCKNITCPYWEA